MNRGKGTLPREQRTSRTRSPLPYLILNIVISALTTLLVLFIWNRVQSNRYPDPAAYPLPVNSSQEIVSSPTQTTLPPLPASDAQSIQITNVFGAGDLNNEVIVLQNVHESDEIWLDGWVLQDEDGNRYVFKALVLNRGAKIQLHTQAGHDTVTDLYWNLSQAVLESGEKLTLSDYQGQTRSTYTIP